MNENLWSGIGEVLAAIALALLLRRFVCLLAVVKGRSMADTLRGGELLFALRRRRCRQLRRFDVVLCHYPGRGKKIFVKRLVALPGERVALSRGKLWINGTAMEENFTLRHSAGTMPERRLGEDEYFVLGDNRPCSHDSRSVGPLPEEAILAVVKCVLWPPKRIGRI